MNVTIWKAKQAKRLFPSAWLYLWRPSILTRRAKTAHFISMHGVETCWTYERAKFSNNCQLSWEYFAKKPPKLRWTLLVWSHTGVQRWKSRARDDVPLMAKKDGVLTGKHEKRCSRVRCVDKQCCGRGSMTLCWQTVLWKRKHDLAGIARGGKRRKAVSKSFH